MAVLCSFHAELGRGSDKLNVEILFNADLIFDFQSVRMDGMSKKLKVLIYGTGFAGQGHAHAFRYASAEVVGIVGRTESVVHQVANELKIPYAGIDWNQALMDCQPDIVSIATPGGSHAEAITQAIQFGCHVFCEKPLTESGETARRLHELAIKKNVKTAFAASFRYMPEVIHAKRLVETKVVESL